MFKIILGNSKKEETPYLYKWGVECFGQVVEFSLSRKEFADFRDKGRKLFSGGKKVKPYLVSVKNRIKEKREQKEEQRLHKSQSKKNAEREAVA